MSYVSFDHAYRDKTVRVLKQHLAELEYIKTSLKAATTHKVPISNLREVVSRVRKVNSDLRSACEYCEKQGFQPELTDVILATVRDIGECSAALLHYSAALLEVQK
jgi:hypothetical protein